MPTRRELLLGLSASSLVSRKAAGIVTVAVLLEELRSQAETEIPDLKEIRIQYNPSDDKVPLMVLGMKL